MATLKQIRANRLNAQNCTGPSSAEGKARSSWNALKSGIQAESEVLPWEDPAERAALRDEYQHHNQPCTPQERAMVDNLANGEFLFRRFRRIEVKIVVSKIPDGADLDNDAVIGQAYIDASPELGRLQRRMDANDRAFHRDLDQLRLLIAERPPFEAPPPLILVPSQPEPPPADPTAPEPDPPAPSPEPPADVSPATPPDSPAPAAEAAPEPANPPSPSPTPQGPAVVLVGLRNILNALSKNRTPTELATLTLPQAAALRKSSGSEPQPLTPNSQPPLLSTSQPAESTTQTQQMVSIGKKPETTPAPPQPPNPQPPPTRAPASPTPAPKPRGFNPINPKHPPIELCHNCNHWAESRTTATSSPFPSTCSRGADETP